MTNQPSLFPAATTPPPSPVADTAHWQAILDNPKASDARKAMARRMLKQKN